MDYLNGNDNSDPAHVLAVEKIVSAIISSEVLGISVGKGSFSNKPVSMIWVCALPIILWGMEISQPIIKGPWEVI